nr:DUF934 domain-containing protein [uncultured Gellertiella sp.]
MTKLWTQAGFVDNDPWVIETETDKAGEGEKPVLPLADFIAHAESSNEAGLAVLIRPADDVQKLAPYLDRIALVAISFPAFSDGRGFSHASLLRSRLGFGGDIRAVGDVLIDPLPHMLRCGFTSFAVTNPTAIKRLGEGRLPGIAQHYQPTALASGEAGSYSWRRLA